MPDSTARPARPSSWGARALSLCLFGALPMAAVFGPSGCAVDDHSTCIPNCTALACGTDGCGGVCGTCPLDEVCTADQQCLPTNDCALSCEDAGWTCGERCGVSCGDCDDACVDGVCQCLPSCTGKVCGADDGCGGRCEPCPTLGGCDDCALQLSLLDTRSEDGHIVEVTLAVTHAPPAGGVLPGLADLRLSVTGPATLDRVAIGAAVLDVDGDLRADPWTGLPWRALEGGVVQLIAAPGRGQALGAGAVTLLRFQLGHPMAPAQVPVSFSLLEREQIFAPPAADATLWGSALGTPIVIWPTEGAPDAP